MGNFTKQSVRSHFIKLVGREPLLVRSPGRINLIGEHTDYNDGFVMPAAIDKEIIFAIGLSNDSTSKVIALNVEENVEINLQNPQPVSSPLWANYLLGVIKQFVDRGLSLKPFICVLGGNIPSGAGMSSSAALECGFAFALHELNNWNISRTELAKIGQWSEHNFVGVRCGIMDQFANMMGKENHVVQLDCRSLAFQYLPMQLKDHSIVLFNSGVKHSLASSEYNVRGQECAEGVRVVQKKNPSVKSLRDVSLEMLHASRAELSDAVFNRCKYVVEEIERVQQASADLQRGDIHAFGKKMYDTHKGLSALYQVSCAELDYLVEQAGTFKEVIGARMMGGGFGGCTINLIQNDAVDKVIKTIQQRYHNQFQIETEAYKVQITAGTSLTSAHD